MNQGSKILYKTDNRGLTLQTTQQVFDSESGSYLPAKTFGMSYDGMGNPLSMTYPGGRVVTYTDYNALELPKQLKTQGFGGSGGESNLAQYNYQGFGRLSKRTVNQGMELTPTFDEIKRVSTFQHKFNGVVGAEFRETYNKVHSKRAEEFVDEINGIHTTNVYRVDQKQRVTGFAMNLPIALKDTALNNFAAILPTDGEDYQKITYDESNNIEKVVTGRGTQTRTHNQMNELTAIAGKRSNIQYDALGRLTSYNEGNDFVEMFWNERDQMTTLTRNGSTVASYEYYPASTPMRALKKVNGGKNESFYCVANSIAEVYELSSTGTETTTPVKEFVHEGMDAPLAVFVDADQNPTTGSMNGKEAYFYQANPRGDVHSLSDENGTILERYQYTLSGKQQALSPDYVSFPELFGPSGASAVVVSGQPYSFTAGLVQVRGTGTFEIIFDSSTGSADFSSAFIEFGTLTEIDAKVYESEVQVTGITGDGTITATLTYTEDTLSATTTFILTVIPSAIDTTLDFAPASPIKWRIGNSDLRLKAIGTPTGGTYAITSSDLGATEGTLSEIDPDLGTITFSGATTTGVVRIDLSYTHSGETARGSILINVIESSLSERIGKQFGFGGAYHDEESGLIWMRHRYYDPSTRNFISRDPKDAG